MITNEEEVSLADAKVAKDLKASSKESTSEQNSEDNAVSVDEEKESNSKSQEKNAKVSSVSNNDGTALVIDEEQINTRDGTLSDEEKKIVKPEHSDEKNEDGEGENGETKGPGEFANNSDPVTRETATLVKTLKGTRASQALNEIGKPSNEESTLLPPTTSETKYEENSLTEERQNDGDIGNNGSQIVDNESAKDVQPSLGLNILKEEIVTEAQDITNEVFDPEISLGKPQSVDPEPAFSTFPSKIITPNLRKMSHNKLRAYETYRRKIYTPKLKISCSYWRSVREILLSSQEETEQAEVMVRGNVIAHKSYASYCNALARDELDNDGNIMDTKTAKKLKQDRKMKYDARRTPIGIDKSKDEKPKKDTILSHKFENNLLNTKEKYISKCIEMQSVVGKRFSDYEEFVRVQILNPLSRLRSEVEEEVRVLEGVGDAILSELKDAERDVKGAWAAYYIAGKKSLSFISSETTKTQKSSESKNSQLVGEVADKTDDVWLAEMHYRMSVQFLLSSWSKGLVELCKIFKKMKDIECHRRYCLQKLITAYLERQDSLWMSLQSLNEPMIEILRKKPLNKDFVEKEVSNEIKQRAYDIEREVTDDLRAGERSGNNLGLVDIGENEGQFELSSPLLSDLLYKASVVQRKSDIMLSPWKTSLAISTVDGYLHMLDIPPNKNINVGSAAEVAFHMLTPRVEVSTEDSIKNNKLISSKLWYQNLIPADSIILPNCSITYYDKNDNRSFEITERLHAKGASKAFGVKTTTRKMYLKTVNRNETVEWLSTLKGSDITWDRSEKYEFKPFVW
mmetsp:Transcript_7188/g.10297  ORF Transcript_7188/g.10297 Transcript_7188/m.10297 type:complete len:798 (-) Transcript_7188:197-2590(-)